MRQFLTERYHQLLARQFRVRFPELPIPAIATS